MPWCTYVDPEIASVGLNETTAKKRNVAYDVIRQEIKEVDRAVLEREENGFVKVLVAKGTDKILGATLVCENAGDLLPEFVLAMIKYPESGSARFRRQRTPIRPLPSLPGK